METRCAILRGHAHHLPRGGRPTSNPRNDLEIPHAFPSHVSRGARDPGGPCPLSAANLTIALGTDVTAVDPHYHNLTPNNNVASHLYGYLVERNEKSQMIPGLATEWKAIDPDDVGVQAAQGRQVPRRQRVHRRRRRGVDRARSEGAEQPVAVHRLHEADPEDRRRRSVHDPLQDGVAVSAHAVGHDAGGDHQQAIRERQHGGLQLRQGGDRHRSRTSSSSSPRATASRWRATTPTGAARRRGTR